jgi:hypothetical protein
MNETYFHKQLATIGETFDKIAGVAAFFMHGTTQLQITCVPVRKSPTFVDGAVEIRREIQDFFLFREQLGEIMPEPDDTITTTDGEFIVVGGNRRLDGVPAVEVLASDNKRILVHTVRKRYDFAD